MGATRKKELMDQISICESLLNRKTTDSFLKRMVTNDEKEVQCQAKTVVVKLRGTGVNRGPSQD